MHREKATPLDSEERKSLRPKSEYCTLPGLQ
jgi:hypothetical protein